MSQRSSTGDGTSAQDGQPVWDSGPSEPESHTEHAAALDATLFRQARDPYELVFELEAGRLRIRAAEDDR